MPSPRLRIAGATAVLTVVGVLATAATRAADDAPLSLPPPDGTLAETMVAWWALASAVVQDHEGSVLAPTSAARCDPGRLRDAGRRLRALAERLDEVGDNALLVRHEVRLAEARIHVYLADCEPESRSAALEAALAALDAASRAEEFYTRPADRIASHQLQAVVLRQLDRSELAGNASAKAEALAAEFNVVTDPIGGVVEDEPPPTDVVTLRFDYPSVHEALIHGSASDLYRVGTELRRETHHEHPAYRYRVTRHPGYYQILQDLHPEAGDELQRLMAEAEPVQREALALWGTAIIGVRLSPDGTWQGLSGGTLADRLAERARANGFTRQQVHDMLRWQGEELAWWWRLSVEWFRGRTLERGRRYAYVKEGTETPAGIEAATWEFTYSRRVPCDARSSEPRCVELRSEVRSSRRKTAAARSDRSPRLEWRTRRAIAVVEPETLLIHEMNLWEAQVLTEVGGQPTFMSSISDGRQRLTHIEPPPVRDTPSAAPDRTPAGPHRHGDEEPAGNL